MSQFHEEAVKIQLQHVLRKGVTFPISQGVYAATWELYCNQGPGRDWA